MAVLLHPLATEKALNMVDRNNIISYVVDYRSTKTEIKKEFEETFAVKVAQVNTSMSIKNVKKAFIKLKPEFKATDVARKLKLV
ncbi:MAG: 50S ribosomal protein L23 [Candidatus Micrarchaeota archaeon]|nr:50S ribosomal protein L23 [Candidatus Micrarchaeota archaeon]MDE1833985.1 50S ribosomal protein L23 [Candidatus Micrarchaeota archaeon]MDE1858964.1 50S ribosomal protein L23 [Candidatus Micrarchaeota archaeon]